MRRTLTNRFYRSLQLMASNPTIHYTFTDEAPALATYALLPVVRRFTEGTVNVEVADISVASRILSQFGFDKDNLTALGNLAKTPDGHIIKLPNVSASVPQLLAAIKELQAQGFDVPDYPANAATDAEKAIKAKYAAVLGSAVNPVLREGNSDRRCASPVKRYAKKTALPVKARAWTTPSKTHVASMPANDFYATEKSYIVPAATTVRIELQPASGETQVLKKELKLEASEVIDASFLSVKTLREYFEKEFQDAKANDLLVSLHLKATMMKISDPIIFGHAVTVYFKDAFAKHGDALKSVGANPNEGLGAVLAKAKTLPNAAEVLADFEACYATRPRVAMVDSGKGITNFHVPSDVIIDASMPPMIRDGGKMWNKDNKLEETKCLIPDRCYSGVFQAIIDDCKAHGQYDHTTLGHVSNVGLMARKAEEYGSHDKTFEIATAGTVRVVDASGAVIFEHNVEKGDIWRMCQTKDEPIRDWVKLAYTRAINSNTPAIFWLDSNRAHDNNLRKKVEEYRGPFEAEAKAKGVEVSIMDPSAASSVSVQRSRAGKDTISVTGNVLRDYNTDMFPIMELGTSAKMLSIVPLLQGGGMYETGAGGSAPKHVQQFVEENHLRWDSLGEYLAIAVCFEDMGKKYNNENLTNLAKGLNEAIGKLLDNDKSPGRKVKEIDNRASTYYIALYWAQAMATLVGGNYETLAKKLADGEEQIVKELVECQGGVVDMGGYYKASPQKTEAAMRPSQLLNSIIDEKPAKL